MKAKQRALFLLLFSSLALSSCNANASEEPSSTNDSSKASSSDAKPLDPQRYRFYTIKGGQTDLSFLQGAPWLNTSVAGTMDKIEKPSAQDDFFAYANYESLQNIVIDPNAKSSGGVLGESTITTREHLNEIFSEKSGTIASLMNILEHGEKDAIKAKIDAAFSMTKEQIEAYLSSTSIFASLSKFLRLGNIAGKEDLTVSFPAALEASGFITLGAFAGLENGDTLRNDLLLVASKLGYERNGLRESISSAISALADSIRPIMGLDRAANHSITIASMDTVFDGVLNPKEALLAFGISEDTVIHYSDFDVAYAKKIDEILNNDLEAMQAIFACCNLLDYRYFMGIDDLVEIGKTATTLGSITGDFPEFKDDTQREDIKRNIIEYYFGEVVNREYVDNFVTKESKTKVQGLVDEIIEQYRSMFEGLTWMSDTTKDKAIEKLDAMHCTVFYDDEYLDATPFEISFADNAISAFDKYNQYYFSNLGLKRFVNDDLSGYPSYFVNAAYAPGQNNYKIYHGLVSSFIDDPNLTKAQFYGRVGVAIGHEISHGFDNRGSNFDKDGRPNSWWEEGDKKKFDEKVENLINFYNANIRCFDDIPMNGENNTGEIIADMGGFRVISNIVASQEDDSFDFKEFSEAFAHFFGWVYEHDKARSLVGEDPHPLSFIRVNFTLSQSPEFAIEYEITSEDGMSLIPNEDFIIWE